eukprot:TRINITY_DN6795_c0_g1_i1.p1 TRINITY_DN6795_c0_g1~~TRINITY_DN6795_c0_g1_i1.p1  ORF type:complete len:207 (-),score=92.11 TRINITY_DN6795_c0_g1_i1:31-630(-)
MATKTFFLLVIVAVLLAIAALFAQDASAMLKKPVEPKPSILLTVKKPAPKIVQRVVTAQPKIVTKVVPGKSKVVQKVVAAQPKVVQKVVPRKAKVVQKVVAGQPKVVQKIINKPAATQSPKIIKRIIKRPEAIPIIVETEVFYKRWLRYIRSALGFDQLAQDRKNNILKWLTIVDYALTVALFSLLVIGITHQLCYTSE